MSMPAQVAVMAAFIVAIVVVPVTVLDYLEGRPASIPAAVAAFFNALDGVHQ